MALTRVLVVEESDELLDAFCAWLSRSTVLLVVGRAHSGQEAIDRVLHLAPDVVLMDVRLPDMNGFEATRRIKARPGAPQVVLMTFHNSHAARSEAVASGADDCITKPDIAQSPLWAIEQLLRARRGGGERT